ncbi:HdeD family acid-resistance protein [Roseovarius dicentrarchi]|uniref:HdeD family acid-resistance protein n=1 Tax=Roseovarius dicentrarchi TaxID=2250573 RepID=UPI000DE8B647|nr:HdeD family acid-resistance protein [Roseovarius dicentrarchi]
MTLYSDQEPPLTSTIRRSRNLLIATGIVMIVAGAAAIAFPYLSSLGVTVCVGLMLVISGIAQGIGAFRYPRWTGIAMGLIFAAFGLIAGGYLLLRPAEGVFALTIIAAAFFLAEGIVKAVLAFQMRPVAGWGWILFDGAASVVLGILLWWQLPSAALWALGVLAGIRIMVSGWTLVMVPIALGRALGMRAPQ